MIGNNSTKKKRKMSCNTPINATDTKAKLTYERCPSSRCQVKGDQWRTVKYALDSVRPFIFDSVALRDQEGLDPDRPEGVAAFLEQRVRVVLASVSCAFSISVCGQVGQWLEPIRTGGRGGPGAADAGGVCF